MTKLKCKVSYLLKLKGQDNIIKEFNSVKELNIFLNTKLTLPKNSYWITEKHTFRPSPLSRGEAARAPLGGANKKVLTFL